MVEARDMSGSYEQRAALYYPYIHIRSENWLKSTILAFQSVKRIVPDRYELADSERIQAYATLTDKNGTPLLDNARIYSERVKQAQTDLFETLKKHQRKLVTRYSDKKTPDEFRWGPNVFQVNRFKLYCRFCETGRELEHDLLPWPVGYRQSSCRCYSFFHRFMRNHAHDES